MKLNDRLLGVWNAVTTYMLVPAMLLSVVLGWSGVVQFTLALLMVVAATVPLVVLPRPRRRH